MKKFATSLDTMHKAMKKWPTADLAVESDDDHDDDQSRMCCILRIVAGCTDQNHSVMRSMTP
jgi:hypothetical protein